MGGFGSGVWHRVGSKPKTDERFAFDIRLWKRQGWLQPGARLDFSDGSRVEVEIGEFSYRKTSSSQRAGEGGCVEESIGLCRRRCHLGGGRPLFQCPGCLAQCFTLFQHGPVYRCRRCAGLAYGSQSRTAWQRKADRANRLLQRLHPDALFSLPPPPRPPRMHHRTFARLISEIESLKGSYYRGFPDQFGVLVRGMAQITGDSMLKELNAALERGDYLNFDFGEIAWDCFDDLDAGIESNA